MESERRREWRENAITLRDSIYGPMFEGLNEILDMVKRVQPLDNEILPDLKAVQTHYLFPTIRQDLRKAFPEVLDRFEKYGRIRRAAEVMIRDVIREEIAQAHNMDIGTSENTPDISLLVGKVHVAWIPLMAILLQHKDPQDFVKVETEKWRKASVEVSIAGKKGDLDSFESLHKMVLRRVKDEHLFLEEEEQRNRLTQELEGLLSQIKVFVDLPLRH